MAKNEGKSSDMNGTPALNGLAEFEKLGGIELDLGRRFFKPRIVPLHSICKGFLWEVREFPNWTNPDTGKMMEALIFKLTADAPAAGEKDALVMVESGQELMVPVNYQLEPLKQFAYLEAVCHEIAIITLEEVPLKGKNSEGKDIPKSMRGFRYKVLRANVPRSQAEQEAAPKALKQLLSAQSNGGKVAPSLSK